MIEEVSIYKTSDGTTFEYEEDAYNYETEYALNKANVRIFNADMQELTKDNFSDGKTPTDVYYIVTGDSNEEDLDNAAEMIYDWVDSSVDISAIAPNTVIMYDRETEKWISIEQFEAHIDDLVERLNKLRRFSEEVQA